MSDHPKAYTVEESVAKGLWNWFNKNGEPEYGGDSKEIAEARASYYKELDEFYKWQETAGNLPNEEFISGSRKFHK